MSAVNRGNLIGFCIFSNGLGDEIVEALRGYKIGHTSF